MSQFPIARRLALAGATLGLATIMAACSGSNNFADRSDYSYSSPIAASAAPQPSIPVAAGGATHGRMPLLPPVPEEQSGLPPVTMAGLLPPPVR